MFPRGNVTQVYNQSRPETTAQNAVYCVAMWIAVPERRNPPLEYACSHTYEGKHKEVDGSGSNCQTRLQVRGTL